MNSYVGDIIEYVPFMGGTRMVEVTLTEDDIKNGRPGFVGNTVPDGDSVWGYNDQIVRIYARKAR